MSSKQEVDAIRKELDEAKAELIGEIEKLKMAIGFFGKILIQNYTPEHMVFRILADMIKEYTGEVVDFQALPKAGLIITPDEFRKDN